MARRAVLAGALALLLATAVTGGKPTVAQTTTPPPSTGIPTCLPPGSSLPPGVTLPPGVSIPTCPPEGTGASLESLVRQLAQGSLPTQLSSQDIAALLDAPSSEVPAQLGGVIAALRQLSGAGLNEPVAAEIACILQSAGRGGPSFSDLGAVPWAQSAIGALSVAGMLTGVLPGTSGGSFAPRRSITQGQWLSLVMQGTGALPTGGNGAALSRAVVEAAVGRGLFPAGGGVSANANASLNVGQAVTLLARAVGLGAVAQQAESGTSTVALPAGTPSWAAGPMRLTHELGLLNDIGLSSSAPFTRADAATLVARSLGLFSSTLEALRKPAITGVEPTPLGPGLTATLSGQNLGQAAGTAQWQPKGGAAQGLKVSAWSSNQVTVQIPDSATTGLGSVILTTAQGTATSVPVQVMAPALRLGEAAPNGLMTLLADGRTFYFPGRMPPRLSPCHPRARRSGFSRQVWNWGSTSPHLGQARRSAPIEVKRVPSSSSARTVNTRASVRRASSACAQGCETLYGPQATPYSTVLSSVQVNYDVPCATIMGYDTEVGLGPSQAAPRDTRDGGSRIARHHIWSPAATTCPR